MLTIRLQRTGTKNRPAFRIVVAEAERSASKKFHEVLGHYNPRSKAFGIKDSERLKYWITQNVQMSPTVHNLLIEKKLVEGKKVKAWAGKKKEVEAPAQAAPAAAETPKAETPVEPLAETPTEAPTETPQS
jgi:small subunit ribosomal protein S16